MFWLPSPRKRSGAAVAILKSAGHVPAGARFSQISLEEPAEGPGAARTPRARRAFAVIYEPRGGQDVRGHRQSGDAAGGFLQRNPGAEPAVTEQDSNLADAIVRADPRYQRAMRERGIRDLNSVRDHGLDGRIFRPAGHRTGPDREGGAVLHGIRRQLLRAPGGRRGGARQPDHSQDHRPARYRPQRAGPAQQRRVHRRRRRGRGVPRPRRCTSPSRTAPAFKCRTAKCAGRSGTSVMPCIPREGLVLYTVGL